jgi:septal ring factor EnvC (AmiA/AmiB activator)
MKSLVKNLGVFFAAVAIEAMLLSPLRADPRHPDWPCVQPKVPELSAAAMWDGPSIADVGDSWQKDPKVSDLVALVAARRTPMDAAQKAIADFLAEKPAEKQARAKELFAGLFATLNEERSEVMDGLERTARKEMDLASKIKSDVAALRTLEDQPNADQHQVKTLADEVEWSTRIFEDRRKTIRYVCEVPTTIEQRVFALGRAIQQADQ